MTADDKTLSVIDPFKELANREIDLYIEEVFSDLAESESKLLDIKRQNVDICTRLATTLNRFNIIRTSYT